MNLDYVKGLTGWEVCPLEEDNLYYIGEKYASYFYYEGNGKVKNVVVNRKSKNDCGRYGIFERNIQDVVVGIFNDNNELVKAFVHEATESLCCGRYGQIMNDYQIKYWVVD